MPYIPLSTNKNNRVAGSSPVNSDTQTQQTILNTPQNQGAGYVPLSAKKEKRSIFKQKSPDQNPNALDVGALSFGSGIFKGLGSMADIISRPILKATDKIVGKGYEKITGSKYTPLLQKDPFRKIFAEGVDIAKEKAGVTPEKQGYWGQVAESFGYSLPMMTAGFATGGAGAVVAGSLEAGAEAQGVYDDLKEQGKSEAEAKKKAAATFGANAILNTLTNRLGIFSGKMNKIPGVKGKVLEFFKDALLELGQEDAQQVISNITTGRKWSNGLKETTLLSLPQTILFSGAGVISKKGDINNEQDQADIKKLENAINTGVPEAQTGGTYKPLSGSITRDDAQENAPMKLRAGQVDIGKISETDFVARERFDIPALKKISFGGSDRDVYDLGNNEVLKIIKTSRGIAQNDVSSDYFAEQSGLIPRTIEIGKNYIVKEKVFSPNTETKNMVKDIQKLLPYNKNDNTFYDKMAELQDKYDSIYDFGSLLNYDFMINDLKAIRNWGTTRDGKPILLDEGTLNMNVLQEESRGLNNPEFREIYNRSRVAKKKFGDMDKKTKYSLEEDVKFDRSLKDIQSGLQKIFGREVPVTEVFSPEIDLGNPNAVGRARKDMILLLKENGSLSEAVANHEGYHWAKQNMPKADAERLSILEREMAKADPKEVARLKELGYKESDIPEEIGANEFAKFYRTGKTVWEKAQIFFEKMLRKLKMIFSKKNELIKEFENIKETVNKAGETVESKTRYFLNSQDNEKKIFIEKDPITYLPYLSDIFEEGSVSRKAIEAWENSLADIIGELSIYESGGKIIQTEDGYTRSQATSLKELPAENRNKKSVQEALDAINESRKPTTKNGTIVYDHVIDKAFNRLSEEYQQEIGGILSMIQERKTRPLKEIIADIKAVKKTENQKVKPRQVKKLLKKSAYSGLKDTKITQTEKQLFSSKVKNFNKGFKEGVSNFKREQRLIKSIERQIAIEMNKPKGQQRSVISFINQLGEFNSRIVSEIKKEIGVNKSLKEMNLTELKQVTEKMKERLAFKRERGYSPSQETVKKLNIKEKSEEKKEFNEDFYKKEIEKQKVKLPETKKGGLFNRLLGSISTRLHIISPELKARLRKFEFDIRKNGVQDEKMITPFIDKIKKIKSKEDLAIFDLAAKNGDTKTVNRIAEKYGMEKEVQMLRDGLNNLYKEAKDVGYDIGYLKYYFPRIVKDTDGLMEYLKGTQGWGIIEEAINRREFEIGRFLKKEEKIKIINNMIRGFSGGQITLSKTGSMKNRLIDYIDGDINRFYKTIYESIPEYTYKTRQAIEARKFFGKSIDTLEKTDEQFLNIEDSIGAFVNDLLIKGDIKPSQELELRDILNARFGEKSAGFVVGAYKNLTYIDTLGSPLNAITQLGDLAFAFYRGGIFKGTSNILRSVFGVSRITKADMGFSVNEVAAEVANKGFLRKMLDTTLKLTGFTKMDRIGMESLANASIAKYRQMARNPKQEFKNKLSEMFPERIFGKGKVDDVIKQLQGKEITEDINWLAFNEVLDLSPRALSEMPEQYLTAGNGRIFYALKTWSIKLLDVYRNEIFRQMKTNKRQGISNMLRLSFFLLLLNGTADEIKDLIRGRETKLSDRVVDNLLKLVGFSRYTTYQAQREGLGSAVLNQVKPPTPTIDNISKDLMDMFNDFDKNAKINRMRSVQALPVGGDLYYYWFGRGNNNEKKTNGGIDLPKIPKIDTPKIKKPKIPKVKI